MKKFFLFLLPLVFFIESCSQKKEEVKIISKSECDKLAFKIKNIKLDDNKYKISGIIKGKGLLYAIFRGYINSNSKISFYTPFGKKLYSVESVGDKTFCIKSEKEFICIDKRRFYEHFFKVSIPFKLKEIITGKFDISNIENYKCEGDLVLFKDNNIEFVYDKNGNIKSVIFNKFKILYFWKKDNYPNLIKFYKNGKYKLKLKIKTIKKVK